MEWWNCLSIWSEVITGEITDREMNDEEYAQHLVDVANAKVKADEAKAKDDAKVALLTKLGITADEAALLLG